MATLYKYLTQGGKEVTFLDKDDQFTTEDIRKSWAQTFGELAQATASTDDKVQTVEVEGEQVEVGKVVSFAKKVGTKGAYAAGRPQVIRQDQMCPVCGNLLALRRVGHQAIRECCNLRCVYAEPAPEDCQLRARGQRELPGLEKA